MSSVLEGKHGRGIKRQMTGAGGRMGKGMMGEPASETVVTTDRKMSVVVGSGT